MQYTYQELEKFNITRLKKIAGVLNIRGRSKWKKADREKAIKLILEHQTDCPVEEIEEKKEEEDLSIDDIMSMNITNLKKLVASTPILKQSIPNKELKNYKKKKQQYKHSSG